MTYTCTACEKEFEWLPGTDACPACGVDLDMMEIQQALYEGYVK